MEKSYVIQRGRKRLFAVLLAGADGGGGSGQGSERRWERVLYERSARRAGSRVGRSVQWSRQAGKWECQPFSTRGAKEAKSTGTGWRPSRGRRGREGGGVSGRGEGRGGGTERPTETNKKTQRRKTGGSRVGGG